MNRGLIYMIAAFGVILFALFLLDRSEFTQLTWLARCFMSDHTDGIVMTILALIGARLVIGAPHQINRL